MIHWIRQKLDERQFDFYSNNFNSWCKVCVSRECVYCKYKILDIKLCIRSSLLCFIKNPFRFHRLLFKPCLFIIMIVKIKKKKINCNCWEMSEKDIDLYVFIVEIEFETRDFWYYNYLDNWIRFHRPISEWWLHFL